MPRPKKWRKVCCLPQSNRFGPLDRSLSGENCITMTVDEYETIRLIDYVGLNQEDCAEQMNVARTTIQGIYFSARKKLAQSIVDGKTLHIDGGDYKLCPGMGKTCGKGCCHGKRCDIDEN